MSHTTIPKEGYMNESKETGECVQGETNQDQQQITLRDWAIPGLV